MQNLGLQNQSFHNHVFEHVADIIISTTCELIHERVFCIFVKNAHPSHFFLVFDS
jgi:hypothetical protein